MRRSPLKHVGLKSILAASLSVSLAMLIGLQGAAPARAAVDHDVIVRDRLNDVRELLHRRLAHREMLNGRIGRFSGELDALQAEREATLAVLADQEDLARALERELDRLMPRLLPRIGTLNRFRKDGARTIAGLASMERSTELAEKTRSRLLAAQTTSIEQMRRASAAVRLLRRVPNAMTARHRDVDFQIPLTAAAAGRLDLRLSQLQRLRDKAIRELADLNVDIDRLTAEEHRLARSMIARHLEGPDGRRPAADGLRSARRDRRAGGKAVMGGADIRGTALLQTHPTPVARPQDGFQAKIERTALTALGPPIRHSASIGGRAEVLADTPDDQLRRRTAIVAAAAPDEASAAGNGRERTVTIPPLVPTADAIGYALADSGRPAISIEASPGQPVAAPGDGRIVFAGEFRSYGLLLIIEHGNGYHTLLWGFSSLDVGLGEGVRAGRILGVLRDGPSPKLHVELRRNGQPVSPEVWLAASNSGVKG